MIICYRIFRARFSLEFDTGGEITNRAQAQPIDRYGSVRRPGVEWIENLTGLGPFLGTVAPKIQSS